MFRVDTLNEQFAIAFDHLRDPETFHNIGTDAENVHNRSPSLHTASLLSTLEYRASLRPCPARSLGQHVTYAHRARGPLFAKVTCFRKEPFGGRSEGLFHIAMQFCMMPALIKLITPWIILMRNRRTL